MMLKVCLRRSLGARSILLAPNRVRWVLSSALTAGLILAPGLASIAYADETALRAELQELRAQIAELKTQLGQLKLENTAPSNPEPLTVQAQQQTVARIEKLEQTVNNQTLVNNSDTTTFFGYGEINYTHPMHNSDNSQADLRRAVIGIGHRFDDRTRLASEFEFEHAIVSADDSGEAEVEQLYIEHQVNNRFGLRAGLMLMPFGLLNEHHEPTAYYGVERNFVETAIIPTTWREGGVALYGDTEKGFNWNVGVTTGFDLSKWDAASNEGRESPLGSIHQELQLAKARDLAIYAASNYQGIPGLLVGGGIFTGQAGQGTPNFPAQNARISLWDVHARWQPGPFDFSALYAHGSISNTEALNLTLVGNPTPVPKAFFGGYIQGAWRAWSNDEYTLTPFLRYERFNTAATYEPIPLGLGVDSGPTEGVWTVGANFNLGPSIVFKADYQKFKEDTAHDRIDLGIGYQF